MSETTPCTAVQTYECKSKSRVKNHTRQAKSETASVLVNKRAVALNQIHDLDVLCKLVKMIEDEPAAQWTRVWSNTSTNALRLRFVRGLRQSYLHAEASFCNVSLNQAGDTIQYIHSFMDCREDDVQNSFDSFDRDTIIKGRVIVEIINANAEPGSSGHYCEKNARSSESRPVPVEAEDVIRERLKAGADIRSIVNHFDRQQAHFKAKEPGVQIPDRYFICAADVRNVRKKYGLDGRLAESDEDDVDLTVKQSKKKRFYRVYKPRGEAWDNSSKRTHGLDLLKRPSGVYLESLDDPAQVFIAMANDVMVENLQRFGSYLLVNASRNIIPAQGLQLLTVFCIDSLGAGVEVLHVLTNHATVGVYERIFAVLGNLHKDRDYMPRSVMCDMVPGLRGPMDAESFRNFKQKIWLLLQDAITTPRVDPIEIDDASSSHGSDRATPSIEEAAPVNLVEIDDASSSHGSDRATSSIEEAAPVNLVEIDDASIHPESDRAASSIGEAAPVDLVEIDDASSPDHDDIFSPVSEMAIGRDAQNSPEYEKRARDDAERFRGDVITRMEADIGGLLAMPLNNVRPDKKPRLCELMITASQLWDKWNGITKQLRAIVQNDDEDSLDPEERDPDCDSGGGVAELRCHDESGLVRTPVVSSEWVCVAAEDVCAPVPDCAALNRENGSDEHSCGSCFSGFANSTADGACRYYGVASFSENEEYLNAFADFEPINSRTDYDGSESADTDFRPKGSRLSLIPRHNDEPPKIILSISDESKVSATLYLFSGPDDTSPDSEFTYSSEVSADDLPFVDLEDNCARTFAFGDVNGDGALDWIVSCAGSAGIYFLLYTGTDDASFPEFKTETKIDLTDVGVDADGNIYPVIRAHLFDFTGDGLLDVVLVLNAGLVHFLSNTGSLEAPDWTSALKFKPATFQRQKARDIAISDVNGDGRMDVLLMTRKSIHTLQNVGTTMWPEFVEPETDMIFLSDIPTSSVLLSFLVYDFFNKSFDEIAIQDFDRQVTYLSSTLVPAPAFALADEGTESVPSLLRWRLDSWSDDESVSFVDFDGDGDVDVLSVMANGSSGVLQYYRNEGIGGLVQTRIANASSLASVSQGTPHQAFDLPTSASSITTASFVDIDGDSDLDMLLVLGNASFAIYENEMGTFTYKQEATDSIFQNLLDGGSETGNDALRRRTSDDYDVLDYDTVVEPTPAPIASPTSAPTPAPTFFSYYPPTGDTDGSSVVIEGFTSTSAPTSAPTSPPTGDTYGAGGVYAYNTNPGFTDAPTPSSGGSYGHGTNSPVPSPREIESIEIFPSSESSVFVRVIFTAHSIDGTSECAISFLNRTEDNMLGATFADVSDSFELFSQTTCSDTFVFGDFDGDGAMDLITSNSKSLKLVSSIQSDSPGEPIEVLSFDRYVYSLSAVDLDGDGDLDIVARSGSGGVSENDYYSMSALPALAAFINTAQDCQSECTGNRAICAASGTASENKIFERAADAQGLKSTAAAIGTCNCPARFQGSACEQCGPGRYGSECKQVCPNHSTTNLEVGTFIYPDTPSILQCECVFPFVMNADFNCTCPEGYEYDKTNDSCVPCARGTFKPVLGLNACAKCPTDFTTFSSGATTCESSYCELGYERESTNQTCVPCKIGTYRENLEDAACFPCPEGREYTVSTGTSSAQDCLAYSGNVMIDGVPESCFKYDQITAGAICEEDGLTIETLPIRQHYWRIANTSIDIRQCPRDSYCEPSNSTSRSLEQSKDEKASSALYCSPYHTGVMCASCVEGYALNGESRCSFCSSSQQIRDTAKIVIWVIAIVIISMLPALYVVQKSKHARTTGRRLVDRSHKAYTCMGSIVAFFDKTCGWRKNPDGLAHRLVASAQGKALILIKFEQIVFDVGITAGMVGQGGSAVALLLNLNVGILFELFAVGCAVSTNYYAVLAAVTLWPMLCALFLAVAVFVSRRLFRPSISADELATRVFTEMLTLMYPGISACILSIFVYDSIAHEVDDVAPLRVLLRDPTIDFDSAMSRAVRIYAALMIVVYPVGVVLALSLGMICEHRLGTETRGVRRLLVIAARTVQCRADDEAFEIISQVLLIVLALGINAQSGVKLFGEASDPVILWVSSLGLIGFVMATVVGAFYSTHRDREEVFGDAENNMNESSKSINKGSSGDFSDGPGDVLKSVEEPSVPESRSFVRSHVLNLDLEDCSGSSSSNLVAPPNSPAKNSSVRPLSHVGEDVDDTEVQDRPGPGPGLATVGFHCDQDQSNPPIHFQAPLAADAAAPLEQVAA
ncbi:Signal peptide, CUB and EGF-like domain-containing protein 2 [Hondaea fermentalgiana]|uniref:Signal peptide, CUB and EGF-like domain-containing protein 2 n=1 Tax=Hondaea fermentalgiana TaxID=2315210 RepID=A0A2R5GHF0_9STRA|nr:Signal peptide, CUB and EGF-like domain-containing protein 2 [Hondaea fermentalgiana]|eukprot:GBG30015.1 Signal peptide, CUB and EGF-like domain-containing protein 2 [Hondaea fermentalgiana]